MPGWQTRWRVPAYIRPADVLVHAEGLGLDVDGFLADVGVDTAGHDRALGLAVVLLHARGKVVGVRSDRDVWRALAEDIRTGERGYLVLRVAADEGPDHVVRSRVRTLASTFVRVGWDGQRMPDDDYRVGGTLDGLVLAVQEQICATLGGDHHLYGPGDGSLASVRALRVLASTIAATLSDDEAHITYGRWRGPRADIYRRLVSGAGLAGYFQRVRELVELDHPEHLKVTGPRGEQVDLGFLDYRGGGLSVNRRAAQQLEKEALSQDK